VDDEDFFHVEFTLCSTSREVKQENRR
jgi:hypothetical protein